MNQDKVINDVMREIELLDDSAKWQVAEMLLHSLRATTSKEETPNEKKTRFADLKGIGKGLWDEDGGVDEFIRKERESWDS